MKKGYVPLLLGLMSMFFTQSIHSQELEIMIVNKTGIIIDDLLTKETSDVEWEIMARLKENDEFPPTFMIVIDDPDFCFYDFKIITGSVEYIWNDIDICNAFGVTLILDEDGRELFEVTYTESEDEEIDEDEENKS